MTCWVRDIYMSSNWSSWDLDDVLSVKYVIFEWLIEFVMFWRYIVHWIRDIDMTHWVRVTYLTSQCLDDLLSIKLLKLTWLKCSWRLDDLLRIEYENLKPLMGIMIFTWLVIRVRDYIPPLVMRYIQMRGSQVSAISWLIESRYSQNFSIGFVILIPPLLRDGTD